MSAAKNTGKNTNETKKTILSPPVIFSVYIVVSGLVILGWLCVFPREPPPLPLYTRPWRLLQGFLAFFSLFPALTMAGMMIPFGLQYNAFQQGFMRFSVPVVESFKGPLITALSAAVVYGILFFLGFPLARDFESELRAQGQIFAISKEKAQIHAAIDAWPEVDHFITVCEQIWPNSPELDSLRVEAAIRIEEWRIRQNETQKGKAAERQQRLHPWASAYTSSPRERNPVNAPEALALATRLFREERYYDAHWLANLTARLAPRGSDLYTQGIALANQARDVLVQLEPYAQEIKRYRLYHHKRNGYEAMLTGDWITAYAVFRELSIHTPEDPEVARFLGLSEQGVQEQAFFIDEIESALGEALTGVVFSLPRKDAAGEILGRMVVRIPWLFTFETVSYGLDLELMALDGEGAILYQATAPYVKLVPLGTAQIRMMMHSVDRFGVTRQYKPIWTGTDQPPSKETQILLDLGYEDFLLLSKFMRGLDALSMEDIFTAIPIAGSYGYIPQVFQAELIYRFSEPALFLPLAILALGIGWRCRTRKNTLYLLPMLAALPLVCNAVVVLYRSILNTLSVWSIMTFGFSIALALFILGVIVLLICSLIFLANE
ncbi:MAG: hypothetical protein LBQ30_00490 [Treponema sp.]|jgi:hypothetical protein|nr:hypothetical protein [Treponema sp.]